MFHVLVCHLNNAVVRFGSSTSIVLCFAIHGIVCDVSSNLAAV